MTEGLVLVDTADMPGESSELDDNKTKDKKSA